MVVPFEIRRLNKVIVVLVTSAQDNSIYIVNKHAVFKFDSSVIENALKNCLVSKHITFHTNTLLFWVCGKNWAYLKATGHVWANIYSNIFS